VRFGPASRLGTPVVLAEFAVDQAARIRGGCGPSFLRVSSRRAFRVVLRVQVADAAHRVVRREREVVGDAAEGACGRGNLGD
jgi:hypothetical protein